jgi:hypothetical protein
LIIATANLITGYTQHSRHMKNLMNKLWVSLWALVSGLSINLAFAIDLTPIDDSQFGYEEAKHLASRAGFGGTPKEIEILVELGPQKAVSRFFEDNSNRLKFEHSGIFDEGLDPFPPSRPATTNLAKREGQALGIEVKSEGNRRLQPIVNKFFYWLRASRLETDRVAYWWANRMLSSPYALQEKMALFWHGHFATNEDKVRDYRKMLNQIQLFQEKGLGNFRTLLKDTAQDPAMLVFLDAGVNTADSPNENFAREIMELFTMGVGNYSEKDVREAARAFTGWTVKGTNFYRDNMNHDTGEKEFLSFSGNYDGTDIIEIILSQDQTSEFIAAKIYRYFVNDSISNEGIKTLGNLLSTEDYHIAKFLRTLFLSKDFYENAGSQIKSPIELMISTYKLMGATAIPGVPDFNEVSQALGQRLLHPPTVAGWSQGKSWITPSLLFERANFVLDVVFPDLNFVPPDRFPVFTPEVARVQQRLRQGKSISQATKPSGISESMSMAQSNQMADQDEDFNTRLGSMRGWQMAIERVRPIPRNPVRLNLTAEVMSAACETTADVVDYLNKKYFIYPLPQQIVAEFAKRLRRELGTDNVVEAETYLEEPLRQLLHAMLSRPEFQLG